MDSGSPLPPRESDARPPAAKGREARPRQRRADRRPDRPRGGRRAPRLGARRPIGRRGQPRRAPPRRRPRPLPSTPTETVTQPAIRTIAELRAMAAASSKPDLLGGRAGGHAARGLRDVERHGLRPLPPGRLGSRRSRPPSDGGDVRAPERVRGGSGGRQERGQPKRRARRRRARRLRHEDAERTCASPFPARPMVWRSSLPGADLALRLVSNGRSPARPGSGVSQDDRSRAAATASSRRVTAERRGRASDIVPDRLGGPIGAPPAVLLRRAALARGGEHLDLTEVRGSVARARLVRGSPSGPDANHVSPLMRSTALISHPTAHRRRDQDAGRVRRRGAVPSAFPGERLGARRLSSARPRR